MAVFTRQFDESERVKTTQKARWHVPDENSKIRQPNWQSIDRHGREILAIEPPVSEGEPELPAEVPHSAYSFDEADLAKAAAAGAVEGFAMGFSARQDHETERLLGLADAIAGETAAFLRSIQFPTDAVRAQLMGLIGDLLDKLTLPGDPQARLEIIGAGIEHCLKSIEHAGPLQLHMAPNDLALFDPAARDRFGASLEWLPDPDMPAGQIRIGWPGGGIERLTAARHEALHEILEGLATPQSSQQPGNEHELLPNSQKGSEP